jgi:hypothetical protein
VFRHSVEQVVGEAYGCRAGEEEGHNLRVVVVHDRSSVLARSFLCPRRSSRRWCQGPRHDSSLPAAASGAARQGAESVDAPGARDSGSFGPSHRLDGYTQANKASTRVAGRKGSVNGKRKGGGASGASFSPLRQNTEQVTGTVVTGRMCNSWVAPLLLAVVQQQHSWAQHGAATGRSAGDAGATAPPAQRRRRGAQLQLLLRVGEVRPFPSTGSSPDAAPGRRRKDGCHGADGQDSSAPRVAARPSPHSCASFLLPLLPPFSGGG